MKENVDEVGRARDVIAGPPLRLAVDEGRRVTSAWDGADIVELMDGQRLPRKGQAKRSVGNEILSYKHNPSGSPRALDMMSERRNLGYSGTL